MCRYTEWLPRTPRACTFNVNITLFATARLHVVLCSIISKLGSVYISNWLSAILWRYGTNFECFNQFHIYYSCNQQRKRLCIPNLITFKINATQMTQISVNYAKITDFKIIKSICYQFRFFFKLTMLCSYILAVYW